MERLQKLRQNQVQELEHIHVRRVRRQRQK